MCLSKLQKYILMTSLQAGGREIDRQIFENYYGESASAHPYGPGGKSTKGETRIKNITRSLERLIVKELLRGLGVRTPHKWFINKVSLTAKGRVAARRLLGEQQSLFLSAPPKSTGWLVTEGGRRRVS